MTQARQCPALVVSAPASGQGKTTVTAALAKRWRDLGRNVQVFKTGPDFLDAMILERASGRPVYQLDTWMGGESHCRELLYKAASEADLLLIEGVMGLFDGKPSTADLAALFNIPVLAVIDGGAMAQTFGAVALGLAQYRSDITIAGTFANRVGGERHYQMLAESLPASLAPFGWLAADNELSLPDRHLGLRQPNEIEDIDQRLPRSAERLQLSERATIAPATFNHGAANFLPRTLTGVRIGVAQDAAFSFLYRANLDTLQALGATLVFFSPISESALPQVDALYLPGGYPELHIGKLSANRTMRGAIRAHHAAAKPIYAECGGMLYLLDSLSDTSGHRAEMCELVPGHAVMQTRLAAIAFQSVDLPEGKLRGHTFHYSRLDTSLVPLTRGQCPNGSRIAESVFRIGRLTASYIHNYFPSNPHAVARLFSP